MAEEAIVLDDREPNKKQKEAIESWGKGDVCVAAGPGSGKTYVLVERFQWLVRNSGIPISKILVVTFTEKAAAHMRRKLVDRFTDSEERKAIERAYISTLHAFCARLLRENAIEAGVDPEFRILDAWEADFELRNFISQALDTACLEDPSAARNFLRNFGSPGVAGCLFDLYQGLRAAGVRPDQAGGLGEAVTGQQSWQELLEAFREVAALPTTGWNAAQERALTQALQALPQLAALTHKPVGIDRFRALAGISFNLTSFKQGSGQRELLKKIKNELVPSTRAALLSELNELNRRWLFQVLTAADAEYRRLKRHDGALDFSDLEEKAIELLGAPSNPLAGAFSFILMDEYQDTNRLQARLVGLLRRKGNFFAVGDINQSIYGFRHADPSVFREYRDQAEQNGHHVPLLETYRSRQEILAAVEQIMRGVEGVEERKLESKKQFPEQRRPYLEVILVHAAERDLAMQLEACHVAARIRELLVEQQRYNSFAILLRTADQIRVFERVLRDQGIPCEVTAGQGYFETREITDLLCFLRVLLNPRDEISLAAVLRSPLVGISDETLLRVKLAAFKKDPTSASSLIQGVDSIENAPPGEIQKLENFRRLLARFRAESDFAPLDRLLGRILDEAGYEAWILAQPGGAQLAANIGKLLDLARRFEAAGFASLQGFVERADEVRRAEAREAEASPPEQSSDAVYLMTAHAAKGLEFPVVFLPAINSSPPRDNDPISFWPGIGVGMLWKDPSDGEATPDSLAARIAPLRKLSRHEEAQRLFYVAMTRAEERLILSASFGSQPKKEHWLKNLTTNLALDLTQIDNTARVVESGGCRFRLLQTNEEPAGAPASLPAKADPGADVLLVDRPSVSDQSDTVVSVTSVALFAQCPRKYYLSRYLGFGGGPGPVSLGPGRERTAEQDREDDGLLSERDGPDPAEFGRKVHDLLARRLAPDQLSAEARALAAGFEESVWGRQAAAAQRVEREQSFICSINGRLVTGQIDLWFGQGGELVLVDYKTDQVKAREVTHRAAEYEIQLRLYALALEQLTGARPTKAVLYFLQPQSAVPVSLADEDLAAARQKVEELFQAQSAVAFPLHTGDHCFRCEHYRGRCPAQLSARQTFAGAAAAE